MLRYVLSALTSLLLETDRLGRAPQNADSGLDVEGGEVHLHVVLVLRPCRCVPSRHKDDRRSLVAIDADQMT